MLGAGDAGVLLPRRGEDPAPVYSGNLSVDPEPPRDGDRLQAWDEAAAEDALDGFAPAPWLVPAPLLAALPSSFSHLYHGAVDVP